MKRLILTLILFAAVLPLASSTLTLAQTEKPTCDPASLIVLAGMLKPSGDTTKDMDTLLKLRDEISAANIACNGMTFKGEGATVTDPFVLPPTLYKVRITTKHSIILKARSLTGSDCKPDQEGILFTDLRLSDQKQDIAASTTWPISASCRVILQVVDSDDVWMLTLEPLK